MTDPAKISFKHFYLNTVFGVNFAELQGGKITDIGRYTQGPGRHQCAAVCGQGLK